MSGGAVGWGIVGTGRIAETELVPAIEQDEWSELVAVASRDRARAQAFADKHRAKHGYGDYEEMLRDPEVECVVIATPNAFHSEQAIAAARAGKHILCDKPFTINTADARRVLEACDEVGVTIGINFQSRYFSAFQETRRAIASGAIGAVMLIQLEMGSGHTPLSSWRADPALAGLGTIYNIGVHGYDLLRYLLDAEVTEATAVTNAEPDSPLETLALAILRFDNGTLAYVNANQVVPDHQPDMAVYGTRGRVTGRGITRPNLSGGELRVRVDGEDSVTRHDNHDAYGRVISGFAAALRGGGAPAATGVDGLRSVELTEALAASARSGSTVRVGLDSATLETPGAGRGAA